MEFALEQGVPRGIVAADPDSAIRDNGRYLGEQFFERKIVHLIDGTMLFKYFTDKWNQWKADRERKRREAEEAACRAI